MCVVRATGGAPDCLTDGKQFDASASWSRDGGSIYFLSHRNAGFQVWKMLAGGESAGRAVQVTRGGASGGAHESSDGKYVYYSGREAGLWRVPTAGGKEELVPGTEGSVYTYPIQKGLYVLVTRDLETGTLYYLADGRGQPMKVAEVNQPYGPITASRDGRTVLFSRVEMSESDLMLVEGFE